MNISSTCPDKKCGRSTLSTGFDVEGIGDDPNYIIAYFECAWCGIEWQVQYDWYEKKVTGQADE